MLIHIFHLWIDYLFYIGFFVIHGKVMIDLIVLNMQSYLK